MELALLVKGGAAGNGELAELRNTYRSAEDAYVEAERLHEETRNPYEEALRAAERRYEADRAAYAAAVEDIREQLQKAPQEYEAKYREILEKYRDTCAREREQVVAAGGLHILGQDNHLATALSDAADELIRQVAHHARQHLRVLVRRGGAPQRHYLARRRAADAHLAAIHGAGGGRRHSVGIFQGAKSAAMASCVAFCVAPVMS